MNLFLSSHLYFIFLSLIILITSTIPFTIPQPSLLLNLFCVSYNLGG